MVEAHSRRDVLKALSVAAPAAAGLGVVNASVGVPSAWAVGAELEPALRLAQALSENAEVVGREVAGLGPLENERALFFLLSAYDLATEMWFQKGDPSAPVLTNWELPWRKYGGDNPTTIYLSAPVSPDRQYRLRGPIGDAVYAGVQVYTKGPGFNAPSANISDTALLGGGREIDLLIGGPDPHDGTPWLPLVDGDYLVMVRLYHNTVPVAPPPISVSCLDAPAGAGLPWSTRAVTAEAFFREAVLSTMSVTEVLRSAGVNRYRHRVRPSKHRATPARCFPRSTTSTTASISASAPGRPCVCGARRLPHGSGPSCSTTAGSTPPDIPAHRCFLTGSDIRLDADGNYEVILGPRSPGHPNWIDTAGLTEGIFAIRYLLPQQRELPVAEVITLG